MPAGSLLNYFGGSRFINRYANSIIAEEDDKKMFSLEVRELEVKGMKSIKTLLMKTLFMSEMAFNQYIFRSVTHGSSHSPFKR